MHIILCIMLYSRQHTFWPQPRLNCTLLVHTFTLVTTLQHGCSLCLRRNDIWNFFIYCIAFVTDHLKRTSLAQIGRTRNNTLLAKQTQTHITSWLVCIDHSCIVKSYIPSDLERGNVSFRKQFPDTDSASAGSFPEGKATCNMSWPNLGASYVTC